MARRSPLASWLFALAASGSAAAPDIGACRSAELEFRPLALLQLGGRRAKRPPVLEEDEEERPRSSPPPPPSAPDAGSFHRRRSLEAVCSRLAEHGGSASEVRISRLQELLSITDRARASLMSALELPEGSEAVRCADLSAALVERGARVRAAVLAATNCEDHAQPSFPFSCSPDACSCPALAAYCDHATYGSDVSRECPSTCGVCEAESPVTPQPEPTLRPGLRVGTAPAARCSEPEGLTDIVVGQLTYRGTCTAFSFGGLCSEAAVLRSCPVSCGTCRPAVASVPSGG